MDDNIDMADRQVDQVPVVDAEGATLVPVIAETDGEFVSRADDGDVVEAGEVVGYVQTGEDA